MEVYRTAGSKATAEYVVEKSKFIAEVLPVKNEEEAKEFIATIRKKYWDATHHVWAYVLGDSLGVQRFSDDGEPSGTAGLPALSVLKKEEVTDLCLVITRYFGGIKLGGGGLVRSYTKAASLGLEAAGIVERKVHVQARFQIPYPLLGSVQRELEGRCAAVEEILYTEEVAIILWIPQEEWEEWQSWAVNSTHGTGHLQELQRKFFSKDADLK